MEREKGQTVGLVFVVFIMVEVCLLQRISPATNATLQTRSKHEKSEFTQTILKNDAINTQIKIEQDY